MKLSPLAKFRNTRNSLYTLATDGGNLLVKSYSGRSARHRSAQERFTLACWKEAGYPVPKICDLVVPQIKAPYLVMTYINGLSLREYFSSAEVALDDKLLTLAGFFTDMSARHAQAIRSNDRNLVHYNSSSGNVLLVGQEFCHVDFEASRKYRSVLDAASVEVANTCRWAVRDLGLDSIDRVLPLMVSAYASQLPVLNRVLDRTLGRSLQFCHRLQDRRRKLTQPRKVTKYDIADALRRLIS